MITPRQRIILPNNVILSREVENRTKSMFAQSGEAALSEKIDVR